MPQLQTFSVEELKLFKGFGMADNMARKLVNQFEAPLSNISGWKYAKDTEQQRARELITWFGKYTYNPTGTWQSPGGMWISNILDIYFSNKINFITEGIDLDDIVELEAQVETNRTKNDAKGEKRIVNFIKNTKLSNRFLILEFLNTSTNIAVMYGELMNRALRYRSQGNQAYFERFVEGLKNRYRKPSPEFGVTGDLIPFYFWSAQDNKPCVKWSSTCIPLIPDKVYTLINDLQSVVPAKLSVGKIIYKKDSWIVEDLGKGFCEQEGAALKHCGNIEGKTDASQTIYSVRHGLGDDVTAHLTITAIPDDKALLALKGSQNQKPRSNVLPKVLDVVTELLKDPNRVQIIVGDSYSPGADVNINDFTDDQLRAIYKTNPNLIHTQAHLGDSKYKPKNVSRRVLEGFKGDSPHKLDANRYISIVGDTTQVSEAYYSTTALYRLVLEGKVSKY